MREMMGVEEKKKKDADEERRARHKQRHRKSRPSKPGDWPIFTPDNVTPVEDEPESYPIKLSDGTYLHEDGHRYSHSLFVVRADQKKAMGLSLLQGKTEKGENKSEIIRTLLDEAGFNYKNFTIEDYRAPGEPIKDDE